MLGDIGTHAHHLASYISGQALVEVAAEVGSVLPGRKVDDFAHLLLRYDGGARGSMWVTNSAAGGEHGLAIKVFGEHGGIEWHQEDPNHLLYRRLGGFAEIMTRGRPGLERGGAAGDPRSARPSRGLFRGVRQSLQRRGGGDRRAGAPAQAPDPLLDFPTVEDGARGVKFVEAAVASNRDGGRWTDCRLDLRPS